MINRRRFLTALTSAAALPALVKSEALEAPSTAESKAVLHSDPLRPQFHFLPPANWMNDPNGPIFWNGKYHMFYQFNPNGAFWGDMHWGHAVSDDMVHWKHLPIALAPTPGGPDSEGCFTGTAFTNGGKVHLMYTGVRSATEDQATIKDGPHSLRESQCLAVSEDPELRRWHKTANPVIANPPARVQVNGFRDPSPWRQGDWWYTVVGSGIANEGGVTLLYRSKDLENWEFMHVLAQRSLGGSSGCGPVDPWEVWECPEFFALGEWHVLICSTLGKAYWQCGKLDTHDMTFAPEHIGILDYGSYYAPKTQLDEAGNRILWGWVQESRPLEEYKAAGWAGMMSLPRILTVTTEGRLRVEFAPQLRQLRQKEQSIQLGDDEEANRRNIGAMTYEGCCGEVLLTTRRPGGPFDVAIGGSGNANSPWLRIKYDPTAVSQVTVDARPIPLQLKDGENLDLHLYADGSVIELLVNGQIAWTKRFYYSGPNAKDLKLRWSGSTASILRLSCWQISPISNDRLTT